MFENIEKKLSTCNCSNSDEAPQKSVKHKLRWYFRLGILLILISVLVFVFGIGARLVLPPRSGWSILPFWENNLFCQNAFMWLAGRCYVQTNVLQALKAAAKKLEKYNPGSNIGYLDASGRKGGKLLGHLSHKQGLDIDIVYIGLPGGNGGNYMPAKPAIFQVGYRLYYGKDGRCGNLIFDRRANLFMVVSLLEQKKCKVTKIFVEPYIEGWLVQEAAQVGLPESLTKRISNLLRWAGPNAAKHDDHFHVRFAGV